MLHKVYCGLFRGRFEELGEHFNRVCYGSTRGRFDELEEHFNRVCDGLFRGHFGGFEEHSIKFVDLRFSVRLRLSLEFNAGVDVDRYSV